MKSTDPWTFGLLNIDEQVIMVDDLFGAMKPDW
jgi:hypothetical protein